jgi:hypothetical protein
MSKNDNINDNNNNININTNNKSKKLDSRINAKIIDEKNLKISKEEKDKSVYFVGVQEKNSLMNNTKKIEKSIIDFSDYIQNFFNITYDDGTLMEVFYIKLMIVINLLILKSF